VARSAQPFCDAWPCDPGATWIAEALINIMFRFGALLLACALLEPARSAAREEVVPVVWKTQELRFDYFGFTSKYSCDGLRDKVEGVLLRLGARRDLEVRPFGCSRMGAPESLPSLQIKISTLIPAGQGDAKDALEARWETVSLGGVGKLTSGDCELADQIRTKILPLFTSRNLKSQTDCVPHQLPAGNILLNVDVLVPAKN
jgi:hypothetical protein